LLPFRLQGAGGFALVMLDALLRQAGRMALDRLGAVGGEGIDFALALPPRRGKLPGLALQ
jgi:hypothetical protein